MYISYDAGPDITGVGLYPTDDKEDGVKKEIIVSVDKYSPYASYNIYLDLKTLPEELKDESFRYAFYNGSTVIKSGSIMDTTSTCTKNSTNHIILVSNVTPTITEVKYTLYLWIDGVNYTNPNDMMNKTFSFTLHADGINLTDTNEGMQGSSSANENNAVTYITNLYNTATKTSVTTAGGEAITQASSLGLMQDSYGNIRYYGATPDNYVTFNGETAGWRIIGIFDVEDENGTISKRIKLIRASSIGTYAFDNKSNGIGTSISSNGSNNWTDARLMMLLNPNYETPSDLYAYEGSLYWNKKSGTCYAGTHNKTKSCDFTTTGLTEIGKNMIDKVKYYLGGAPSYAPFYANTFYSYERATGANYWTGYVGIMYPSDYAYATDLSVCTKTGNSYSSDKTNCNETDWLLDSSTTTWTITPCSQSTSNAFHVHMSGDVIPNYIYIYTCSNKGVRPVVYLKSTISIVDGTGDINDPFVLA